MGGNCGTRRTRLLLVTTSAVAGLAFFSEAALAQVGLPSAQKSAPVIAPVAQAAAPVTQAAAQATQAAAPVTQQAAPAAQQAAAPVTQAAAQATQAAAPVVQQAAAPVTQAAAQATQAAAPVVQQVAAPVAQAAAPVTQQAAPVVQAAVPVVQAAAPIVAQVATPIAGSVAPVTEQVVPALQAVTPVVHQVAASVTQVAAPVTEPAAQIVAPLLEATQPGTGATSSVIDPLTAMLAGTPVRELTAPLTEGTSARPATSAPGTSALGYGDGSPAAVDSTSSTPLPAPYDGAIAVESAASGGTSLSGSTATPTRSPERRSVISPRGSTEVPQGFAYTPETAATPDSRGHGAASSGAASRLPLPGAPDVPAGSFAAITAGFGSGGSSAFVAALAAALLLVAPELGRRLRLGKASRPLPIFLISLERPG